MHFSLATVTGILLAAVSAFAQNQMIMVGNNGQLAFDPPTLTASPGSNVTFMFMSKNHSVVQSSFAAPCTPLQNGFAAQFFPIQQGQTQFPTVTINVNTQNAIWFYCPQTNPANHCQMGMVGGINVPADKPFDQFQAIAKGEAPPPSGSATSGGSSAPGTTAPTGAPVSGAPVSGGAPPPGTPPTTNSQPAPNSPVLPPSTGSSSTSASQPSSTGAALPQMKGASVAVVIGLLGVVASLL